MQFGISLVDRGLISAEQFVEAVRRQLADRVPLGQLAIEHGMLSVREVFELLRAQSQGEFDRFGQAAIEKGMLSKQQVAELLLLQADRRPPLTTIMCELGYLTREQVEDELAVFRRSAERIGASPSTTARAESELELAAVGI